MSEEIYQPQYLTAEQIAALEAEFADIPLPETVSDTATLEDMLGEGEVIRRRGLEFVLLPPSIKELAHLRRIMNAIPSIQDEEKQMDLHFSAARRLFHVHEANHLRPATREELETKWTLGGLVEKITDTLLSNGLGDGDEKKGA